MVSPGNASNDSEGGGVWRDLLRGNIGAGSTTKQEGVKG